MLRHDENNRVDKRRAPGADFCGVRCQFLSQFSAHAQPSRRVAGSHVYGCDVYERLSGFCQRARDSRRHPDGNSEDPKFWTADSCFYQRRRPATASSHFNHCVINTFAIRSTLQIRNPVKLTTINRLIDMNRRNAITVTAAGLIHLSDQAQAEEPLTNNPDLLIRRAKDRGLTDLSFGLTRFSIWPPEPGSGTASSTLLGKTPITYCKFGSLHGSAARSRVIRKKQSR